MSKPYFQLLLFFPLLLLGACASQPEETGESTGLASEPPSATQPMKPKIVRAPQEVLDEIDGYHQSIPFDGIAPVYEPRFTTADEAPYEESELILGVSIGGEAKAYPISVLRFREMVNDELAGTPILTTW